MHQRYRSLSAPGRDAIEGAVRAQAAGDGERAVFALIARRDEAMERSLKALGFAPVMRLVLRYRLGSRSQHPRS